MKKFYALIVIVILVIFAVWIFKDKETTLGEEFPDVIRAENVSEINVTRGSDNKEVTVIEENSKENLLAAFLDTDVKKVNGSNKDNSESYWITIKSENEREFGFRIDNELNVAPYEYRGSKKNSDNYLFSDDKVLKLIESLF